MTVRVRALFAALGVFVLALGSMVLLSATAAFACSCVQMTPAEQAAAADEVFVGTITSVEGGSGMLGGGQRVTYDVAVDEVWKGDVPARVTVTSGTQSTACGLPDLPESEPVVFFAETAADRRTVNSCGGTTLVTPELTEAVTAALGEPVAAGQDAGEVEAGEEHAPLMPVWSEIALAALVLGLPAIGLAVLAFFLLRRRR